MTLPSHGLDLASLSILDDPVRRRLYEIVSQRSEPVGRDEAAATAGIGRALAIYHLDKLVESGLLTATYRRPAGRTGPGAGRPAKLYTRSDREFAVTVPARDYELAARLLARAVASDSSGAGRAALQEAANQLGSELGSRFRPGGARADRPDDDGTAGLEGALSAHGYEPVRGGGVIRLRNCPFRQLAEQHRDLVCGMNLGLIQGIAAGLGVTGVRPVLDPRPGLCCVAIGADQP
jgi:predicted ArsR family transcriptional regulator